MNLKASPVDYVALALDGMDIGDEEDFVITEKESKQWFGSAVGSKDYPLQL